MDNPASQNTSDNAVQFDTYLGQQSTRAGYQGNLNTGLLKEAAAGFGVFAYLPEDGQTFTNWSSWDPSTSTASNKAPNFMYNQKVTWNAAGYWDYSPVKYWPNGVDKDNATATPSYTATEANTQSLSFFAYAPYVIANTEVDYDKDNGWIGGDLPDGVTAAVYTSDAAATTLPTTVQNGIVAMSKNDEAKDMYVKYILNTNTAATPSVNAVDLLWGVRGQKVYEETDANDNEKDVLGNSYNTDLTKQVVGEKVKFLFKHALSRVGGNTSTTSSGSGKQICGLKAVVDVDANSQNAGSGLSYQTDYFSHDFDNTKTLVTIEEVNIRDPYTYTVTEDGTPGSISDEESTFLTDGWFDVMNGQWKGVAYVKEHTTTENGATYKVKADKDGSDYKLNPDIAEGTVSNATGADWQATNSSAAGYTGGATGVTTTAKPVYASDQDVPGLLLIPGTAEGSSNDVYVTVKYIVRTADPNLSTGFSAVTQTITNKVSLDGSILKPNQYYTLVMHLGLTSVKFEAVVADWASTDDPQYDENGGVISTEDENPTSIWLPSNVVSTDLGKSQTFTTPTAGATLSFTVTGVSSITSTPTITGENSSHETVDGATIAADGDVTDGRIKYNVTIPANNTSYNRTFTATIAGKDADNKDQTTTVTIEQPYAPVTLSSVSPTSLNASNATIKLEITDADGSTKILKENANITVYKDGTELSSSDYTIANGSDGDAGKIIITLPNNTSASAHTYEVKAKVHDDDATVDVTGITQAAFAFSADLNATYSSSTITVSNIKDADDNNIAATDYTLTVKKGESDYTTSITKSDGSAEITVSENATYTITITHNASELTVNKVVVVTGL